MSPGEKVGNLRSEMKKKGFNAFVILRTEPGLKYGMPGHWELLSWLTGFTGSAGTLVITEDFAGLWTDSRYTIQARKELKGSGIQPFEEEGSSDSFIKWLGEKMSPGAVVGVDGKIFPAKSALKIRKTLAEKGVRLADATDFLSVIRKDSPQPSLEPVMDYSPLYSGKTRREKFEEIRKMMSRQKADFQLLASLDDIAWFFNLRGNDISHTPLFDAFALISRYHEVLFIDDIKLPGEVKAALMKDGVILSTPENIEKHLADFPEGSRVHLNPAKTALWLFNMIPSHCRIVEGKTIPAVLKTCKNETEIKHIRNVMVKDGVALVKFFMWLEKNCGRRGITEYAASVKLDRFRNTQENYTGTSFPPIVAYRGNGAKVHYTPLPGKSEKIERNGILLVDSGGQYIDGTTDTTRTVSLGNSTDKQKRDFTLVLKGHIELATTIFPEGTMGFHLDALARKHLWQEGKNYGHGTGHGVGFFLNVHEGPPSISPNRENDTSLEPGMVLSNEPGIYREGEYGIRTENLVLVKHHSRTEWGRFLAFETLTLFPVDRELIVPSMLTSFEKKWLNSYHLKVWDSLSGFLDDEEKAWLKDKTRRI